MAEVLKNSQGSAGGNAKGQSGGTGAGKGRKRKVYEHVMTSREKFALQTVQRAQSALAVINDAIKSGKAVKPEIIDLCFTLSKTAGQMLFGTD